MSLLVMLKDFFAEQLATEAQRRYNPWLGLVQHTGSAWNLSQSPPAQWPGGTQTGHLPSAVATAEDRRGCEGNESFRGAWRLLACPRCKQRAGSCCVWGRAGGQTRGNWPICTTGCEGACVGTWVMPKWSKEKGPSTLTVPCKATCTLARAECEEQSVSCIKANDGSYRVMEQTD